MDIVRPRSPRRRFALPILAAAVVVVVMVLLLAWRSWPAAAQTASVERASVFTETVRRGDLVRKVPVQGALVPEHVEWLSATAAARVAKIAVRPGARVEPDTVVVVLENTDLELAALEAEQKAATADAARIQLDVRTESDRRQHGVLLLGLRAELEDAERHAASADRLAAQGLLGEIERRDAAAKRLDLAQRVRAEEGRQEILRGGRDRQLAAQSSEIARLREIASFRKRQLASLQVRAGTRGIVQELPLENGQWVAAGTLLAKVAELDHLRAEVKVAEASAKDLRVGLAVRFDAPAGMHGTIDRIDPAVVLGTVKVLVALAVVPPGARADQGVSGYAEIETLADVLVVARPAGARDHAPCSVFRLEADGASAVRVPVRLGRGSVREMEVESGLSPGDRIIVSDTSAWDTSARVRLR